MNSWQKQRRNTNFILECMMIKRGLELSKENIEILSDIIDREEQHLIDNNNLGLRGSFHKQILYNLSDDNRVKEYIKELEQSDCNVSLYKQLGVLEALKDFFELNDAKRGN